MVGQRGQGGSRLYVEVERCPPARDGDSPTGVVRARGELDLETADDLADSLDARLWSGCEGVLVDLTEVRFMDSSGLRAIVLADRALGDEGLCLAVATEARSQVEGVLELTGLRERLPSAL
jgi:anti-sigma B factor antagonist